MRRAVKEEGLATALLSLLAHDLRAPLGPISLATSMLFDDPGSPQGVRDLAAIAEAQSRRMGRMIDAALAATHGVAPPEPSVCDLAVLAQHAVAAVEALGSKCTLETRPSPARADASLVVPALAGLMEAVAGEGGEALVTVSLEQGAAAAHVAGAGWAECAHALTSGLPRNAPAAYTLGAAAVFRAHGGGVDIAGDAVVAWLPATGR